jgi:hypothetical protein
MRQPVLKITTQHEKYELYMLNPGEHFSGFGGSRTGLTVGKTASSIVRRISPMGTYDTELDIFDNNVWQTIANWINETDSQVVASH